MPNWDTQLSIPLVDTVYYLKDAIIDSSVKLADSIYVYHRDYAFEPVSLGDTNTLKLSPPISDTTIFRQIGTLSVPSPKPFEKSLRLSQILDSLVIHRPFPFPDTVIYFSDTATTTVPSFPPIFTMFPSQSRTDTISLPPNPDFAYIVIDSGGIKLSIQNNLPTAAIVATIKIINSDNNTIVTFPSITIGSNASDTSVVPLAGKKLTSALTAIIQVDIPATPLPLTFSPADSIDFRFEVLGPLTTREARLALPAIPIDSIVERRLILDQSTYVNNVDFKRGTMVLSMNSTVNAGINFLFRFDEMKDTLTKMPFEVRAVVSPSAPLLQTLDLRGYTLEPSVPESSNTMKLTLVLSTVQGDTLSTIYDTSSIKLRIQFLDTPLLLKSISGRLKTDTIQIVKDTVKLPDLHLGSDFTADSITLGRDTLRIQLHTDALFPIDVQDFSVKALRKDGTLVDSLTLPLSTPPGNAWRFVPGAVNAVEFTGGWLNAFLRNFPNGQPDRLIIQGMAIVNPVDQYPTYIGHLNDTDYFHTNVDFIVPLSVAIYNGAFKDTVRIGGSGGTGPKIDKKLLTSIVQGNFTFVTTSTIPAHAGIRTYFLDTTLASPIILVPDSIDIFPGSNLFHYFKITRDQAVKFNQANKIALKLLMDTPMHPAVFDTTQYIRVRLLANIVFNVDPTK
jgi:hypothetical protein